MDIKLEETLVKYFDILSKEGYFPNKATLMLVVMIYANKLIKGVRDYEKINFGTYNITHEEELKLGRILTCLRKHCLV